MEKMDLRLVLTDAFSKILKGKAKYLVGLRASKELGNRKLYPLSCLV